MKDQHTKIKGYRDLSQQEIDLMNRIKEHGEKTKELLEEINSLRQTNKTQEVLSGFDTGSASIDQRESLRCLDKATMYLQTGQMWFVRAVALPDSF